MRGAIATINSVRRALWQRLAEAESFVTIAKVVCTDATTLFELSHCCVGLHDPSGRPVLIVDNIAEMSDDRRLAWVDGDRWQRDPLLQAMREHRGPAGDEVPKELELEINYAGASLHALLLPLVEPGGLIGSIRCGRPEPFSEPLRRDLAVLSTHVSVRLAQLGVTTVAETVWLSPRQHEVARLAARGLANHEIAHALAISENTVKKRLKEVFLELCVSNRTELTVVLRPLVVSDAEAPIGTSRDGALTITRGARRRPAGARGS